MPFKTFLECLGLSAACAATVDVDLVRRRYRKTLLRFHPDKAGPAGAETTIMLNTELPRFLEWRARLANPPAPPPWEPEEETPPPRSNSRPFGAAKARPRPPSSSTDHGGNAHPSSASSTDPFSCPSAPHCKGWERKHAGLDEVRSLEYKFLYAASAGCLQCMRYYAGLPNFDVRCVSSQMNARGWAAQANVLTQEMDDFLRHLGL